jgi:hypothetical protein
MTKTTIVLMKKWAGSPQHYIVDPGTIEAQCLDVSSEANDLIILETVMIVHNSLLFAVNLPLGGGRERT